MLPFKAERDLEKSGATLLKLSGSLNESAKYPELTADDKNIVIDMSDVDYLNSIGILQWLQFCKTLEAVVTNCEIQNIPSFILEQMGKVRGTLPKFMTLRSFYAPFYCESCETSTSLLYQGGVNYFKQGDKVELKHPTGTCPSCEGKLTLDVMPERFFAFLNSVKIP